MDHQHIPAWKRLGFKLQNAQDSSSPTEHLPETPKTKTTSKTTPEARRPTPISNTTSHITNNSENTDLRPPTKKQKRVSFSSDTKLLDGDTARSALPSELAPINKTTTKQPKAATKSSPHKPNAALSYLHDFYHSHSTWKFNKNRETWILKHALDTTALPDTHNLSLAQYIHGLKSDAARERLRNDVVTKLESRDDSEQADDFGLAGYQTQLMFLDGR